MVYVPCGRDSEAQRSYPGRRRFDKILEPHTVQAYFGGKENRTKEMFVILQLPRTFSICVRLIEVQKF